MGFFSWLFGKEDKGKKDEDILAITIKQRLESGEYRIVESLFDEKRGEIRGISNKNWDNEIEGE